MTEGDRQGTAFADRQRFLQAMALAGLASSPAMARSSGTASQRPMMHGVLGAASAGPGRPKITMLVHPKMAMQDLIGPLTVFNLIHSEIHLVWKKHEAGLSVMPSTVFADFAGRHSDSHYTQPFPCDGRRAEPDPATGAELGQTPEEVSGCEDTRRDR
jgi:hypothetical protein